MANNKFYLPSIVVLLLLLAVLAAPTQAQQSESWLRQQQVPGHDNQARVPYLIADQDQAVHAFNSKWIGENLVIVYSRWTLNQRWTPLIDIVLPPFRNQARLTGASLDNKGIIHLTFFAGDDINGNIYHTSASALQANDTRSWTRPIVIGPDAVTPHQASQQSDGDGNILVVYSGKAVGNGLYAIVSKDNGVNWSEPEPIFLTLDNALQPTSLTTYSDNADNIHVAWSVVDITGNGQAVYYARFDQATQTWSEAITLATAIEFEADTPQIVEYDDQLLIVFHNEQPTTRFMRRSIDNGQTWSAPTRPFPSHVGSNGPASFVVDSNNQLRMFFGNRTRLEGDDKDTHGMWQSLWLGDQWSEPRPVIIGERIADEEGGDGFDPSFARVVVSQGNTLLVLWRTDPSAGQNGIWYTATTLDSPQLPLVPLPTVPAIPTALPETTEALVIDETTSGNLDLGIVEEGGFLNIDGGNPGTLLIVGLIPAVILITSIVLLTAWQRRS